MKKILVPTDFSDCADNGANAAIAIAKKTGADIRFVHLMAIPVDWINLEDNCSKMYPEVTKKVNNANHKLDKLVENAEKGGVSAVKELCYNESYDYIINSVKTQAIDLIVMGSHGARGFRELLAGSNTQKIVRLSPVPVLIVKRDTQNFNVKNIVFASDFSEEVMEEFKQVVDFTKRIGAKLHLLFVNTPLNFTDSFEIKIKMGAYALHAPDRVESTNVYNCNTLDEGLIEFSKEHGGDMLAMITHGRKGISRLFNRSITESVVNHYDMPVLSLHLHH